jgi:PAS domain S-box-containing protein
LKHLTREELEAEVVRLRAALENSPDRAIEDAHTRYRLAVKATNDAIWDWDVKENHVLWNDALERAYGHALDSVETTGEWWLAQMHPEDRNRVYQSIHGVIDGTQTAWSEEYRFRRSNGTYAQVLDRGHVIRDADGQAERMIGAMLDLTQMRNTEAALRESEERFRTILETVEAAFAIVQVKFDSDDEPVDYRFLEANPAFEREAGVNLRGKWVTEFAPDLERFWFETYGRVAKTRVPINFESYAKAFERWFDVRAVPVGDPSERQIAIIFNDVTGRRDAEERLRKKAKQLPGPTCSGFNSPLRPVPSSAPGTGICPTTVSRWTKPSLARSGWTRSSATKG